MEELDGYDQIISKQSINVLMSFTDLERKVQGICYSYISPYETIGHGTIPIILIPVHQTIARYDKTYKYIVKPTEKNGVMFFTHIATDRSLPTVEEFEMIEEAQRSPWFKYALIINHFIIFVVYKVAQNVKDVIGEYPYNMKHSDMVIDAFIPTDNIIINRNEVHRFAADSQQEERWKALFG